jgi:hypothetical protein
MPASNITASTRYYRPDVSTIVFASAVANKNSPTRAEINAGTALENEIAEVAGFSVQSATVDTPDLGSRFISQVDGDITVEDSSITFWASSNSTDVRGLLPRGTVGFLLFMDESDTSGRRGYTFPIKVTSTSPIRERDGGARVTVSFAVTSEPGEYWVVPA